MNIVLIVWLLNYIAAAPHLLLDVGRSHQALMMLHLQLGSSNQIYSESCTCCRALTFIRIEPIIHDLHHYICLPDIESINDLLQRDRHIMGFHSSTHELHLYNIVML
jgi:hypothetical protein